MLDDRAPQDQDIDARIVARGQGVARQAGTGAAGRSPWLDPRQAPGLKLGNDPPGHLVIEVRPVLGLTIFARTLAAGTTVGGFSHRYPPSPTKKQQTPPHRRGWAAKSDQKARPQWQTAPPRETTRSTPSAA